MRSQRQHKVDIALARALQLSGPWLVAESIVKADAARMVAPRATDSELTDAIRYHDGAQRLTSQAGEVEMHWKLNANGVAWLSEHA